ncbi:hypothetical protein AB0H34_23980 [Saccharopolyspora shandongensis]|uniref:hypothetical protein n=1 Tax=Saccharopolyspora shandongensis TaxID=418495 RepID=UPI003402A22E
MDGSVERYVNDLKLIRKNRGLCVSRVDEIGAALREACGVTDHDLPADAVGKIGEVLRRHAQALGRDQRVAALGALGLDGPQTQFLKEREKWVAGQLERNVRTARRRTAEGFAVLASLLATGSLPTIPGPSGTWRTERLRVLLALDQPRPESFVFRQVIAEAEVLDELDLAMTLTADRSASAREKAMSVDVFSGGTLVHRSQQTSQRTRLALRPPKPLLRGEKHEIAMRFQVSEMAPHYVCVPMRACEEFDLTVRFGSRIPQSVGLLRKVLQNDVQDEAVTGEPLEPDGAGEVRARFRRLEPGFAYGIRWRTTPAKRGC